MSDSGESETFHGNSAWLALREEQYGNQGTATAGHAPQPIRTQSLGGTHVLHAFIDGAAAALRPQSRVGRLRGTHGRSGGDVAASVRPRARRNSRRNRGARLSAAHPAGLGGAHAPRRVADAVPCAYCR